MLPQLLAKISDSVVVLGVNGPYPLGSNVVELGDGGNPVNVLSAALALLPPGYSNRSVLYLSILFRKNLKKRALLLKTSRLLGCVVAQAPK